MSVLYILKQKLTLKILLQLTKCYEGKGYSLTARYNIKIPDSIVLYFYVGLEKNVRHLSEVKLRDNEALSGRNP